MAWIFAKFVRSLLARTALRPRAKPRLPLRPSLEHCEERNPPSSLLDAFTMAFAAQAAPLAFPLDGSAAQTAVQVDYLPPGQPVLSASHFVPPDLLATDSGSAAPAKASPAAGQAPPHDPFDPFDDPFSKGLGLASGGGGQQPVLPPEGLAGQPGAASGGGAAEPGPAALSALGTGQSGTGAGTLPGAGGTQGSWPAPASAPLSPATQGQGQAGQGAVAGSGQADAGQAAPSLSATRQWAQQAMSAAGLRFEQNAGQFDQRVDFAARGQGYGLFLTSTEAVLLLKNPDAADAVVATAPKAGGTGQDGALGQTAVRFQLVGSDPAAKAVAGELSPTRTNYFSGGSPDGWHADVANYGSVRYQDVYDGVDLVYYGTSQGQLEYDFAVAAGKDASQVRMSFDGVLGTSVDAQGNLVLSTAAGDIVQQAPVLYQEAADGTREAVSGTYRLFDDGTVGFGVGTHDASRGLRIDPVVSYGTLLGGVNDDAALGVAADGAGSAYVTGWTMSPSFPTGGGPLTGTTDAFVSKIGPSGAVVYTSYLGGSGIDKGFAIAVDAGGNAFVTGYTGSGGGAGAFPTTPGAWRSSAGLAGGASDTFAAKLNATGNTLLYATVMSGTPSSSNPGSAGGIAIDLAGNAYVVGSTGPSLPLFAPFQPGFGGGASDAFLVKLDPTGANASLGSFLGGTANDFGTGVALSPSGDIYISGWTSSLTPGGMPASFPTTPGAFQTTPAGGLDAFAAKINAGGTVGYATLLGGSGDDEALGIAVDGTGSAYVAGWTQSPGFPATSGGFTGSQDAFVTKLNPAGTAYVYSRIIQDGYGVASAQGVAIDSAGTAWIAGTTSGTGLTLVAPSQPGYGGGPSDAFVVRLDPAGASTLFATYEGGTGTDKGNAIAIQADGSVFLAGNTNSPSFPVARTGPDYDAYVLKLGSVPPAPTISSVSPDTGISSSDRITNASMLALSGTATPGSLVTLFLAGLGQIGTATANATTGAWSFAYATALAEGVAAFSATATASGKTSARSADFLATVDLTAPVVALTAPATTTEVRPEVTVTASDLNGLPDGTVVTLDVDLDNDTLFTGLGETGFATATLAGGAATFTLPTALAVGTTVGMRARVADLAGNQGGSATSSVQVVSVVPWTVGGAGAPAADPEAGDAMLLTGALRVAHGLDLDRSEGTAQSGGMSLVYDSGTVGVRPIVQATVQMDNATALPASIVAQLTWDGVVVGSQTFYPGSTAGVSPGSLVTLALQVPTAVPSAGRHRWQLDLTINTSGGGTVLQSASGSTFTVANDTSPYGAGWSFSGVDRLYYIPADVPNALPAGVLRVFGTGGWRFYQDDGAGGWTSPAEDNGTLAGSVAAGWTYTTPDGQSRSFNAAGMQTGWLSTDGNESLAYSYIDADGDGQTDDLSSMMAIDGAATSFIYSSGKLSSITTAGGRAWLLSVNGSGDLASVSNPDTAVRTFNYSSHRMTGDALAGITDTWGYDPASGTLRTVQAGTGGTTTAIASATRGLGTLWRGKPQAQATDPLSRTTTTSLDARGRALSQRAPDGGTTTWTLDAAGRVVSVKDPLNRTTGYVRDAAGYVTSTSLPGGGGETWVYGGPFHSLTLFTDERGNGWSYTYDGQAHLLTETDPLSETWTYTYSTVAGNLGLVATATDPLSRLVHTYAYDTARRLVRDTDYYGNYRSWTFDANGNTDSARDERGSTTTFVNDAMGRVKEEHAPITGIVAYWNWNGAGLLTSMTDAEGRVSTNDYDSRGLLAKSVQGYGSATPATELFNYDAAAQLTGTRSATGWWSYLGYDADGRQDSATDEKGFVSRTLYDLAGQAVQAKDNLGNLTTWAYAVRGWVDSATDAGGTTVYGHNASGDVTSATDPASHTTSFDIDKLHRTTKVTDPLTFTVRTDFTAAGDTDTVTDQRSIVTKEYFDPLHRLASETQAFGTAAARTETDQYDEDGDLAKSWDWAGKLTSYAYDTMDRLASATDPLLHTVSQALDKVGEVLASTDALLKATGFAWNALGQNTASTDPDGHADGEQHDPEGHVVLTTDGAGDPSWRAYDERGQLVLETDARGGTTKRSYDADGHLSVLVDPAGNTWTWQYDHLDREVKRTDPYGNSVLTAYNTAGLVASVTDRDGRSKTYAYDADDRETSEAWKDAGGTTVDTLGFAYDQAGNLLTAANSQGTYTRTYDAFGRVTAQTGLYGVGYTFTYDVRGYRTGVTDTLGGTTASTYDDAGRLVTRTFTDGTTSLREDLGYDARDERTNESRYADLAGTVLAGTTVRGYDDAGNLTGLQYKDGSGATISDYANVFDAADRIASETRNGGTPTTYSYDTTSQLKSDSSKSYSYDLAGNRTLPGYSTGASNRITSDGTWSFSYDAEGNVVKRSKGASAETWTYGFDNNNQMLWAEDRATDGGTLLKRVDFAYDAFSQRVKESVTVPGSGTTVREYAFADDGQVQAELASTNALVTRYIRGDGQGELWARVASSGGAAWLLQDRLGSLRDVANASGVAIDHIDYDAFGNVTAASAPGLAGDFTWTGLWKQRETEMFHAFWRDYGASWGGWMQQDPSVFGGGDANLGRYCGNDPTNGTDLSGLIDTHVKRFWESFKGAAAEQATFFRSFYKVHHTKMQFFREIHEAQGVNIDDVTHLRAVHPKADEEIQKIEKAFIEAEMKTHGLKYHKRSDNKMFLNKVMGDKKFYERLTAHEERLIAAFKGSWVEPGMSAKAMKGVHKKLDGFKNWTAWKTGRAKRWASVFPSLAKGLAFFALFSGAAGTLAAATSAGSEEQWERFDRRYENALDRAIMLQGPPEKADYLDPLVDEFIAYLRSLEIDDKVIGSLELAMRVYLADK